MTKPMAPEIAGAEIRHELNKLPGHIIAGVGAREQLRELCQLTPTQFANGVAFNLARYNDIFVVINGRRQGSIYMITADLDLDEVWLPIADGGHYMHARFMSLSDMLGVRLEGLIAQGAPLADQSIVYSWRRAVDQAAAVLAPVVDQAAYRAHVPDATIERWSKMDGRVR